LSELRRLHPAHKEKTVQCSGLPPPRFQENHGKQIDTIKSFLDLPENI
jgi:hypothetical protein